MNNIHLRSAIVLSIVLALFYTCQTSSPETIHFIRNVSSLDKIKAEITESGKKGLLYFTTATCGPCKMLQREVFINDSVRTYVEANFMPFWVDADSIAARDLNRHFSINAVPTMVLVDNEGAVIDKVIGYSPPQEYLDRLKKSLAGDKTILSFREAYEADPANTAVALEYAVELSNKYDFKNAQPIYEQLIDKFEDKYSKAITYYNLGACYRRAGNEEKAAEIYEKGLKQDLFTEKKDLVLCSLGTYLFQQNEYKSAIDYLEMLSEDVNNIEDFGERHEIEGDRFFLALAYYKLGNEQRGKTTLNELCQNLFDAGNWFQVAEYGHMCIINDVGLRDILPWTEKAVESSDWQDSYALSAYGFVLIKNHNYKEAIEVNEKELDAREIEPAGPDGVTMKELMPERYAEDVLRTRARLAVLHFTVGDTKKGELLVEEILETASSPYAAYRALTFACVLSNPTMDKALYWAEQAVELDQRENTILLDAYAELLFANGQIRKAVEVATRVCELSDYYGYRQNLEKFQAAL